MCGLKYGISLRITWLEQRGSLPCWSEELFAEFNTYASVNGADDRVSEWYLRLTEEQNKKGRNLHSTWWANLSGDSLDDPRKIMVFPLSMPCPGSKVTEFAVIPVVSQPHLRTNEENLFVVNDDSAVVVHVLVVYRPVSING
jgi:hypothetical protein